MRYIERMKEIKEAKGLTANEISQISGVPLATVNRIFSGSTPNPTIETIASIATAMGATLDEITGLKPKEAPPSPVVTALDSYAELLREKDVRISDLKADREQARKDCRRYAIAFTCVTAFILVLLLVDILNGHFGYFRY